MRCPWGAKPELPVGRKAGSYRGAPWVLRTVPQQHLKGPEMKARVTGQLFPQCLSDYGRSLASHLLIQTVFTKCLLCASEYREPGGLACRLWAEDSGQEAPPNPPPPCRSRRFIFSKTGMRETVPLSQGYWGTAGFRRWLRCAWRPLSTQ